MGSFWNFYRDEPNIGLTGVGTSIKDFKLKIQNLLITKQVLQQNQKVTIQKKRLKLLCH